MLLKVFKNRIPNSSYFFHDGLQAAFLNGRYETGDARRIQELEREIRMGHPFIYVDEADSEVDTEAPTPLEILKREAYEQAKADLLASGQLNLEKTSTSDNGNVAASFANTATIAEAAADSTQGTATGASLPATALASLAASVAAKK